MVDRSQLAVSYAQEWIWLESSSLSAWDEVGVDVVAAIVVPVEHHPVVGHARQVNLGRTNRTKNITGSSELGRGEGVHF